MRLGDFKTGLCLPAHRPEVVKANEFAPTHSRIFKELLLVCSADRPIQLTPKGTVRRKPTLDLYETEIEELYRRAEEASDTSVSIPYKFTAEATQQYIEALVKEVMRPDGGALDVERDLFDQGCDRCALNFRDWAIAHYKGSLQATFLRNRLLAGLRSRSIDPKPLPLNLIYIHPSISALSSFITSFVASPPTSTAAAPIDRATRAKQLDLEIAKWTSNFPSHTGTKPATSKRGVLITGTTGTLGSYLLEVFARSDGTSIVYAVNRPSRERNEKRVREALTDRGVDLSILDGGKVKLVEADLTRLNFGVKAELFKEVLSFLDTDDN